jgi:spermidine synthase
LELLRALVLVKFFVDVCEQRVRTIVVVVGEPGLETTIGRYRLKRARSNVPFDGGRCACGFDRRSTDPLQDPRVNIIFNDARNALRLTNKTYDAIVSQPSHPWTAGASHLFTREFIGIVKEHLNEDGVLLQWMNTEFVDEGLLRSLAATLVDSFDYVRIYGADATVLFFLASDSPLNIEREVARTGRPLRDEPLHYSYMGFNSVDDFIVALMMDETGVRAFAADAPLSTDNQNLMATRSRSRGDGLTTFQLGELFEPHDPLLDASSWVHREFGDQLNFAYVASRLFADNRPRRVSRLAEVVPDLSTRALISALGFEYNGEQESMYQALRVALDANPNNDQAKFKMLNADLPSFALGEPSAEAQALAAQLSGVPAAVIEAWPIGAQQDWAALTALDGPLSRSLVTDLWYSDTVKLRADWRTKVIGDPQYAYDALRLVDRALVIAPELDLYVLRAAAAAVLEDQAVFVESGRYVAGYIRGKLARAEQGSYVISDRELTTIIARLTAFDRELGTVAGTDVRAQDVHVQVSDLLRDVRTLQTQRSSP